MATSSTSSTSKPAASKAAKPAKGKSTKPSGLVQITAPWANYQGLTAGVQFVNGKAEVAADHPQIGYFARAGYGIVGTVIEVSEESGKSEKVAVNHEPATAPLTELELDQLKALADSKGVEYPTDATAEHLVGLLDGRDAADGNEGASTVPPAGQSPSGSASA